MLDLDPIKARLARATPGPWEQMPSKNKGGVDRYVGPPGCGPVCEMSVIREKWGDDMRLIANAPTDLGALVQEAELLRNALVDLLKAVTEDGSTEAIMLAAADAERVLGRGCKNAKP